jgi:hypothetical protein
LGRWLSTAPIDEAIDFGVPSGLGASASAVVADT